MSDMKCPFCQQEAYITEWESANSEAYCPHCDTAGDLKLWQELICTRKALDVAVDALKELKRHGVCGADIALEKITALEQKDAK